MLKTFQNIEYEVLRLSYGLDCDKHSGKSIAKAKLNIVGASDYVRVSELKKAGSTKINRQRRSLASA